MEKITAADLFEERRLLMAAKCERIIKRLKAGASQAEAFGPELWPTTPKDTI